MIRRLNRTEYNNTLRDLFGVDLHAGDLLPSEGGGGEGFDNTGATLFTSPVLLEKYLEAADLVLGTVLLDPESKQKAADRKKEDAAALADVRRKLLITAAPAPGAVLRATVPPCAATCAATIASPRPVPPAARVREASAR